MQLYGYDENDLQLEAENRIRNLMWTVSGDYALDTKVESAFIRNPDMSASTMLRSRARLHAIMM